MRPPPGVPPPAGRGGAQRIPRPPGARRGAAAPWAEVDPALRRPRIADLRHRLETTRPPRQARIERIGLRRASAVLAPLYEHDDDTWIVLTRRSPHLRAHRSEVSFPGGRQHHGEPLTETALREAHEEISLDPSRVEIVGELDHLATISSGSSIVPYVGVIDGRPDLEPDPAEVEAVLHVPLAELLDPEIFREERWNLPPFDRPIYFFELEGDTVWGATAAMLVDLLSRITGTDAEPGL